MVSSIMKSGKWKNKLMNQSVITDQLTSNVKASGLIISLVLLYGKLSTSYSYGFDLFLNVLLLWTFLLGKKDVPIIYQYLVIKK